MNQLRFLLAFVGLFQPSTLAQDGVPVFVDVTAAAGIRFEHVNGLPDEKNYIFEAKGGGAAFFDFDSDGWMDLYLVQGATVETVDRDQSLRPRLFRNLGDGQFEDVTDRAGFRPAFWGMGVSIGDYDNDGLADLYLTNLGPDILYRNLGDGRFEDVTARAGIEAGNWTTSAAFGDMDRDGDLDLYVTGYLDYLPSKLPPKTSDCTYLGTPVLCGPRGLQGGRDYLYENNGDGTFTDVTLDRGAVDENRFFGLSVIWTDLNNDELPDILVGNDATPNLLFVNQGNGRFEEGAFLAGLAVSGQGGEQASMGVDAADYDNDGLLDVFFTHFAGDYSTVYHNEGDLYFRDVTSEVGLEVPEWNLVGWGTRFLDLNLDGWKDIIHANGHVYPYLKKADGKEAYEQPPSLYVNDRNGRFIDAASKAGTDFSRAEVGRGVAFADYDNDGDVDLLIANMNGRPRLLRNDRTDQHHWFGILLEGSGSNRDAIGALVTLVSGGLRQIWEVKRTVGIYSSSDPRAHFGLGNQDSVQSLEVRWPNGEEQRFENLPADRYYRLKEGEALAQ